MAKIKTSLKKNDKFTKEWHITIPKEILHDAKVDELKKISQKVTISGFRKGHAPVNLVEKQYSDNAFSAAMRNLILEKLDKLQKEENYTNLAKSPKITFIDEVDYEKDLYFSVTFNLEPTIPDIKYEKITIETATLELTADEINQELLDFAKKVTKEEEVLDKDYEAKIDDILDINFIGKIDSVPFEGGSAENHKLTIGSKTFISNFEEQLIGVKKGESITVNVTFPEEYHHKHYAGKDASFDVTVNKIYSKTIPEINDEFAKKIESENLEQLKNQLKDNLIKIYDNKLKEVVQGNIIKLIVAQNQFDLPSGLVADLIDEEIEKIKKEKDDHEKACTEHNHIHEKFDEKETRKKLTKSIEESLRTRYLSKKLFAEKTFGNKTNKQIASETMFSLAQSYGFNYLQQMFHGLKEEDIENYLVMIAKDKIASEVAFEKVTKNSKKLNRHDFDKFLLNYKI
jgi:trigger factor